MKINREVNGQIMEFELTSEELYTAFLEQNHRFDRSDVLSSLELKGLPDRCYGILESTGEVVVYSRGERGYSPCFPAGDAEFNKNMVDEYNDALGVSKAQAAAMQAGSMFGWNVPAANPAMYDENGNLRPVKKPALDSIISSAQDLQNDSKSTRSVSFEKDEVR